MIVVAARVVWYHLERENLLRPIQQVTTSAAPPRIVETVGPALNSGLIVKPQKYFWERTVARGALPA